MNRAKKSLLWAVGLTVIAIIFWVLLSLRLSELFPDDVTTGRYVLVGRDALLAVFFTIVAAILWNKVRGGVEDSRIAERVISETKKTSSWLSWAVIECSILAIMLWVFFGLEVTNSPRHGEDVWFGAVAAVFFSVVAIGLYIKWSKKKRKPE